MSPQQSIAHYRIVSKLGEGGMGAVSRAIDTKLNREIAVKVLPEAFAADPDRLARFTREAQLLAQLNHPNIAAIYGVEERALVLELVEGAELRGPLSEAEALPIVRQLIDALEYAHERGVIHRDLKPANLKITPDGRLKVLDFGLAKAITGDVGPANPASSPTLTISATMAGAIMGTAAYMAPEQARGHNVASAHITPHPKSPCQIQDWSPDGSSVLCASNKAGNTRAFLLPLAEEGVEKTILDSPYSVVFLRFSPDGKYVAYASYELGSPEIFVAALSPSAPRRRVSTDGGSFPIWARNTNKLFYRGKGKLMMEVDVGMGAEIKASLTYGGVAASGVPTC